MYTIFFKKNKKGFEGITWETIVFFLAAIILIVLVAFFLRLQSALFAEKDDGSKANLIRLDKVINELLGTSSNSDSRKINYFIGIGKALLGFNTNDNGYNYKIIAVAPGWPDIFSPVYKPFKCGNSACLCLYDRTPSTDANQRDQGVLRCERVETDKNVVFSSSNIFSTGDSLQRTRRIKIEKTKSGNTYSFSINNI